MKMDELSIGDALSAIGRHLDSARRDIQETQNALQWLRGQPNAPSVAKFAIEQYEAKLETMHTSMIAKISRQAIRSRE